jgi:LacI family transcriptional regulator
MGEKISRATLGDVAKLAKVSVTTASRVLTQRGDFTSETRVAVLSAANDLHYSRSTTSRGRAAKKRLQHIELVLSAFESPWSEEVIAGSRREAFELGFDLTLTQERENPVEDWPIRIVNRRPSGVILGLIVPTRSQLKILDGFDIPTVLLDPGSDPPEKMQSVGCTNFFGGEDAAKHLVDCGYTKFAIATSDNRYRFGRARELGFRGQIDLIRPRSLIKRVDVNWDGTLDKDSLTGVLNASSGSRLGIFAINDLMASRVLEELVSMGVSVPKEVGIIGFDDDPSIASVIALTTIRQPISEMARRAVQLIHESQIGITPVTRLHELETELVIRSTTAKITSN